MTSLPCVVSDRSTWLSEEQRCTGFEPGSGFLTNHARRRCCHRARGPGARLHDVAVHLNITRRSTHGIVADLTAPRSRAKNSHRNRCQIPTHACPCPEQATPERTVGEVLACPAAGNNGTGIRLAPASGVSVFRRADARQGAEKLP